MKKKHHLATRVIHAGQSPDPSTGAVMTPIYATSTYAQESPGRHKGYDYARSINPTRSAYERCVADLESGTRGWAFASGLAAMSTALETIDSGSHVVVSDDLYGGTYRLFEKVRRRSANLDFTFIDMTDAVENRERDQTEHAHGLGGNPEQSAAQADRSRSGREDRAEAQRDLCFRQHLRQPVDPAADRARFRHGDSFRDEISQRPFRHGRRRRGRGGKQGARGSDAILAKLGRRDRGTVRQLPRHARVEDARLADGAPLRERARARRAGWRRSRRCGKSVTPA